MEVELADDDAGRRCAECHFDWTLGHDAAVALVAECGTLAARALSEPESATSPGWSRGEYLWHLVDVVRISAERIFGASIKPDLSVVAFDPDELASARRYAQQRLDVGLKSLGWSVRVWRETVAKVPVDTPYLHPELGAMTVADVVVLVAHEVHHHVRDMGGSHR